MRVSFDENYICSVSEELLNHKNYVPILIIDILDYYYPGYKDNRELFLENNPDVLKSISFKTNQIMDDVSRLNYPENEELLDMDVLRFIDENPHWRNIVSNVEFGKGPEKPNCLKVCDKYG